MKERVFAAVRGMKREQWLICGLAGLLLLVIAAPVKQKEKKKTQEKTTVSQTQEQTDDQIRVDLPDPRSRRLLVGAVKIFYRMPASDFCKHRVGKRLRIDADPGHAESFGDLQFFGGNRVRPARFERKLR